MDSSSAAALKLEIARLSGAINRHKTGDPPSRSAAYSSTRPRNNVYVNPNYKPLSKSATPAPQVQRPPQPAAVPGSSTLQKRDVVIGGVAFESSGRSLVRKDLPKPISTSKPLSRTVPPRSDYIRNKTGTLVNVTRAYKPRSSARGRLNHNMTLDNTRRSYQSRRLSARRAKYVDKPCPLFTTTGACNRGLTCMYQHDPAKIAICWPFLQGSCPNNAETCALSHDPTPERTPLCVHFANNGRCTRADCPFPHVRVGTRGGVCRDFAVLGYCAKGLDCEQQHVRECPDFAEKGACATKGCKLPHVIRANRSRKMAASDSGSTTTSTSSPADTSLVGSSSAGPSTAPAQAAADSADASSSHAVRTQNAKLGDEFISLTFNESESEDEDEDADEDEEDDGEELEEHDEEGLEPHEDIDMHEEKSTYD